MTISILLRQGVVILFEYLIMLGIEHAMVYCAGAGKKREEIFKRISIFLTPPWQTFLTPPWQTFLPTLNAFTGVRAVHSFSELRDRNCSLLSSLSLNLSIISLRFLPLKWSIKVLICFLEGRKLFFYFFAQLAAFSTILYFLLL